VLAWHVDYWDYLGWKDPFGSKEATERQKRYVKARGLKSLQTPHFFVANRPARDVPAAVKEELKKKPRLLVEGSAVLERRSVVFHGKVKALEGMGPGEGVEVRAVLFARKKETKCDAGENKGKKLVEYYVVLGAAEPVSLAAAMKDGIKVSLPTKGEEEANLGIAILVEDPEKAETLECAAFRVDPA